MYNLNCCGQRKAYPEGLIFFICKIGIYHLPQWAVKRLSNWLTFLKMYEQMLFSLIPWKSKNSLVKTILVMSYHLPSLISSNPNTIYDSPLGKISAGEQENAGENSNKSIYSCRKLTTIHSQFPLTYFSSPIPRSVNPHLSGYIFLLGGCHLISLT